MPTRGLHAQGQRGRALGGAVVAVVVVVVVVRLDERLGRGSLLDCQWFHRWVCGRMLDW